MPNKFMLFFCFILLSSHSLAYGPLGHRVIAEIAQARLSPSAQKNLNAFLQNQSLVEISTWADEQRYSQQDSIFWSYDYSSSWHFINIDQNTDYENSSKSASGDAYLALITFIEILQNITPQDKVINQGIDHYISEFPSNNAELAKQHLALNFLVHLVADLHQPMHLGYAEDRGGNSIDVWWFDRKTNLHSVWDSRLIQAQSLNQQALLTKLITQTEAIPFSEQQSIAQAAPIVWINEGLILREQVYDIDRFSRQFKQQYVNEFTTISNQQLIKAGLRLSYILNDLFE